MNAGDFQAMLAAQNSTCPICNRVPKPTKISKTGFVVDHCHKSEKVRALLCQRCNSGLGMFCDDTTILRRAIAYLASRGKVTHGGSVYLRGSRWWWRGVSRGIVKAFSFASFSECPTHADAAALLKNQFGIECRSHASNSKEIATKRNRERAQLRAHKPFRVHDHVDYKSVRKR
jgi:hypothetical protein